MLPFLNNLNKLSIAFLVFLTAIPQEAFEKTCASGRQGEKVLGKILSNALTATIILRDYPGMDISTYKAVQKWAEELEGVFTIADLKVSWWPHAKKPFWMFAIPSGIG